MNDDLQDEIPSIERIEIALLLEGIYQQYGYRLSKLYAFIHSAPYMAQNSDRGASYYIRSAGESSSRRKSHG